MLKQLRSVNSQAKFSTTPFAFRDVSLRKTVEWRLPNEISDISWEHQTCWDGGIKDEPQLKICLAMYTIITGEVGLLVKYNT